MSYVKRHAIKVTLDKSIRYILNKNKTESLYVYGLNCSINAKLAYKTMMKTKVNFKKEGGILGFHFVQSFKKGEIKDPNEALKIAIEFSKKITDNKYEAVVVTHTDKDHIHNHIIINSVSHVDGGKYNSCKDELKKIREINDKICKDHGLSIITPKDKGKSYKEWLETQKGSSWKEKIKNDIDITIDREDIKSFEDFIKALESKGYEIKYKNLKHIVFKMSGQQRGTRGRSIGIDYTEEAIRKRISDKEIGIETIILKSKPYNKNIGQKENYHTNNIYNNMRISTRLLYLYLNKNKYVKRKPLVKKYIETSLKNLEMSLEIAANKNINTFEDLQNQLKDTEIKIKKISNLIEKLEVLNSKLEGMKTHIDYYNKNKEVYDNYISANPLKKIIYKNKYSNEIEEFKNSREVLKSIGINEKDMSNVLNNYNSNKENLEKYNKINNEISKDFHELKMVLEVSTKIDNDEYVNTIENAIRSEKEESERKEISKSKDLNKDR
ncbi:relaxase/mobilization nuclease domain-containing protein [Clostridium arbusti]|uniref:relaxase/mobilization nuclease domain-containing protein n=1 Tax=Clostridium arbusti TaxID=1137848 RepID=UPI0002881D29|nr:relaxase/mobilization nuclease domain-containing protein [Clostridium arbusti]